jgi:dTDP-glucose 4,6-dehydratase/UDP-glucose 4-epimerase
MSYASVLNHQMLTSEEYGVDNLGVKDALQTFLGIWLRLLIEKRPIKVFGDGLQLRDFNYVDDCVDALLLSGANEISNGKVYNLGSGEVIRLKDLAELLIEINGAGSCELVPFPVERKNIDIGDYYSNFDLISSDLDWQPKVGLKLGLEKSLKYYRKNYKHYWADSE